MRFLGIFLLTGLAYGAACTNASPACTEFVTLGGGPSRSLIYRSHSLDARDDRITRALIVIHGTNRDADNYFRTALAAAFLANALDDTEVIVPRIASNSGTCHDALAANEVSYSCGGDSWRSGGTAANNEKLTSFDFIDELLRKLAARQSFPNLKAIVLAGHSAGGQFVNRYEMSNRIHEKLAVPVTYVVANPSSYAYLDNTRPVLDGVGFRPYSDARNCITYDHWPYGLQGRTGYAARSTDEQLRKQLASRPVTYLLGDLDTLPLGGFDSSCPAMAQGATRLARGLAFARFVNEKFEAKHQVQVVELCGHNARCMFTAESALPLLFPKTGAH